ncbi:MAG: peroxiredoxin family protein [Gammaproteobacteria bacterium]
MTTETDLNVRRRRIAWLAATLLVAVGCAPKNVALTDAPWRAVIELPGGELPFTVTFGRDANGVLQATLANGDERVPVSGVTNSPEELLLSFPAFNNTITLRPQGARWRGELALIKRGGVTQRMPVTLSPGKSHRFYAEEQDVNADFAGTWAVEFVDDEGIKVDAVGEFQQQNGRVTGTFRTPTGDYRYLEGQVSDRELRLSTFDGAHAFLFVAQQAENGEVRGDFWSGTKWHETFTARRDANARLPDASNMSQMRDDVERVAFTFPDTRGQSVSLTDERFQDKVVVVALAGSWCPNCHDEAAFLAPYYQANRQRGLEVVGLMFEHLPEFAEAAVQVGAFRRKFDIQYPLLVAGYSDKKEATQTLGLLDEVIAYPTMIVLDRSGAVRWVHTGFNGPGTGVHYDEFRAEFAALMDQLLEEDV